MKIGITTFQWSDNYGAVLQAYALQSFLRLRGHDVQIVDYRPQNMVTPLRRWLAKTPGRCVRKWEANWKKHLFELFRRKYLIRTPEVFCSAADLQSIADRFDLLITGSDQVWNPRWLSQVDGFFDLYFLIFASARTRCISYAASIGYSDLSSMKKEWRDNLSIRLKRFDAISVRERSAINVVRQLSGRTDAVLAVDPTLLLERRHYEKIAGGVMERKKILFSYILHGIENDAETACQQITKEKGLEAVVCNTRKTRIHTGYTVPSPIGWLRQIRDATFVVTNSFHGTVFCLIFHVPFVSVLVGGEISSMNSRIVDLLESAGLAYRILHPQEQISQTTLTKEINWYKTDRIISSMRAGSIAYLAEQGL